MHAITNSGWVEVITGCVFSDKTEELLRRLRRAEIAGQDVAASPPPSTTGRTATIGSHVGRRTGADVVDTGGPLPGMREALNGEAVVADDETIFSVGRVVACDELAADGRRVLVSGTDQTVRDEPFDPISGLVASAEYVDEPRAICSVCGEPRPATSGSSTANPPTTGTRRSWSVPRSPAGRAFGTTTRCAGAETRRSRWDRPARADRTVSSGRAVGLRSPITSPGAALGRGVRT
mgnify:FL=1